MGREGKKIGFETIKNTYIEMKEPQKDVRN